MTWRQQQNAFKCFIVWIVLSPHTLLQWKNWGSELLDRSMKFQVYTSTLMKHFSNVTSTNVKNSTVLPSATYRFPLREGNVMESKLSNWELGTQDWKNLMLIISAYFLPQYDNVLKKMLRCDSRDLTLKYTWDQACTVTMRSTLSIST